MIIHRAYKYRIYPTPNQERRLVAWDNALRFLWNLAHEQRLMGLARTDKRYPTAFDQMLDLKVLRAELPWLADVPHNVCARLLTDLANGWDKCFGRRAGMPHWRRKNSERFSFSERHHREWRLQNNGHLKFPKLGQVPIVIHREPLGDPKICTIVPDGDQWFAVLVYAVAVSDPAPRADPVVAIDRGITYTLATSDGRLVENPKHYEKAMKRLAHAQRVVCRRKKGSKNREKAKLRVMRLHRKVRRQREHFLHVESARLAKSHGVVVIEKLNVAGMKRGRVARGIAGAGWGSFAVFLRYKLESTGGALLEVPARYTSQTCAACGNVDAGSRRGETFACACGHRDHADLNAAKVILSRASRAVLPVEVNTPEVSL